jgi:hypothetical protein
MYPRFAARFLDLNSVHTKHSQYEMSMLGAHPAFNELTASGITLRLDNADLAFHPTAVLLDRPPIHSKLHGTIGVDLLSNAADEPRFPSNAARRRIALTNTYKRSWAKTILIVKSGDQPEQFRGEKRSNDTRQSKNRSGRRPVVL